VGRKSSKKKKHPRGGFLVGAVKNEHYLGSSDKQSEGRIKKDKKKKGERFPKNTEGGQTA